MDEQDSRLKPGTGFAGWQAGTYQRFACEATRFAAKVLLPPHRNPDLTLTHTEQATTGPRRPTSRRCWVGMRIAPGELPKPSLP